MARLSEAELRERFDGAYIEIDGQEVFIADMILADRAELEAETRRKTREEDCAVTCKACWLGLKDKVEDEIITHGGWGICKASEIRKLMESPK